MRLRRLSLGSLARRWVSSARNSAKASNGTPDSPLEAGKDAPCLTVIWAPICQAKAASMPVQVVVPCSGYTNPCLDETGRQGYEQSEGKANVHSINVIGIIPL